MQAFILAPIKPHLQESGDHMPRTTHLHLPSCAWLNLYGCHVNKVSVTNIRQNSVTLLLLAFHLSLIYLTFPFFISMSIHYLLVLNSLSAILRSELNISPNYNSKASDSVQD